jgi:hypothetical protein
MVLANAERPVRSVRALYERDLEALRDAIGDYDAIGYGPGQIHPAAYYDDLRDERAYPEPLPTALKWAAGDVYDLAAEIVRVYPGAAPEQEAAA